MIVVTKQLFRGQTRSCGCLMRTAKTKHGFRGTKVYGIWTGMKNRCLNPNNKDYSRYGGRGIGICPRWKFFELFLKDMGEPPDGGYTIERIDNNKDYTKSNCKWILRKEQALNRRDNIRITIGNITLIASEWDRIRGFFPGTVARRITKYGWSHYDAATKPIIEKYSMNKKKCQPNF